MSTFNKVVPQHLVREFLKRDYISDFPRWSENDVKVVVSRLFLKAVRTYIISWSIARESSCAHFLGRAFLVGDYRVSERFMYRCIDCKATSLQPSRRLPRPSDEKNKRRIMFTAFQPCRSDGETESCYNWSEDRLRRFNFDRMWRSEVIFPATAEGFKIIALFWIAFPWRAWWLISQAINLVRVFLTSAYSSLPVWCWNLIHFPSNKAVQCKNMILSIDGF